MSGKSHIELTETDRTKLEVASDTEDTAPKQATQVEDSDDEDEDDEPVKVEEPEPEPEPVVEKTVEADDLVEKPKKKVVKKVKKTTAAVEE